MAKNKQGGVYERRANAKLRLEQQLESKKKPLKVDGRTVKQTTDLTEGDIKRIETQIDTLDKRMKSSND